MNNQTVNEQPRKETHPVVEAIRLILLAAMSTSVMAALLFISAWRIDWWMAWVYVGMNLLMFIVNSRILDPGLVEERSHFKDEVRGWDRVLVLLIRLFTGLIPLIVAGLDMRFGWTRQIREIALATQLVATVILALALALLSWSMASNKFFSDMVRIQSERGHVPITGGPYRYVRHPGYLSGIVQNLTIPLMLSSLWALIPSVMAVCFIVIRTALEDKVLRDELGGYEEYTQQVRYRLVPGIW